MKRIFAALLSIWFIFNPVLITNTQAEKNVGNVGIVSRRGAIRSLYKTIPINGYTAVVQGNYYLNSYGEIYDGNLTMTSTSSALKILDFSPTYSGSNIYCSFTYSSPSGGATVIHFSSYKNLSIFQL